jgi:hypothetical protein
MDHQHEADNPIDHKARRNDELQSIWGPEISPEPTTLLKRFTSQPTSPPSSVCDLRKSHGFSFLCSPWRPVEMADLTKDSRRTERIRQLHPLPRADSNSRYRLCFAPSLARHPVAGASRSCGSSGRKLSPSALWPEPKLNVRTYSVIHTTSSYDGRTVESR